MKQTVSVKILDEVYVNVTGLQGKHSEYFVNKYSLFAAGYFFNPKYKLGRWDGRIPHFSAAGKTYVYLLSEIIPDLVRFGYNIDLVDMRSTDIIIPDPVHKDIFAHCIHPDTQKPIQLREYQVAAINSLLQDGNGICLAGTGAGKALSLNSQIQTPTGFVLNKDIKVGDEVLTPSNEVATVLGVYPQPPRKLYYVCFQDNVRIECCDEHLWEVVVDGQKQIINTLDIIQVLQTKDVYVANTKPIQYEQREFDINLEEFGKSVFVDEVELTDEYLFSSIKQRYELLKGLLANCIRKEEKYVIVAKLEDKERLLYIKNIVSSLGGLCTIYNYKTMYDCVIIFPYSNFDLFAVDLDEFVFDNVIQLYRRIYVIYPSKIEESQCIYIDHPSHMYLTDDYVPTHNTIICAGLLQAYTPHKIKTITIVPDQNLIMQTKKTYIQCGLDVGEYSGQNKDINHQHVVSTWQALQKNHMIMNSFDLTLVDECHGLKGASLRSIVCDHAATMPYRFGVTGTLPKEPIDALSVNISVGFVKYEIPAHELIDLGVLAKLNIDVIQLEENLVEEYNEYVAECKGNKPVSYSKFKDQYYPDYPAEKSYLQHNPYRTQWIADKIMTERDRLGNVLCLVGSIPIARKLAKLIPNAICVNGQDIKNPKKRQEVYDLFEVQNGLVVIATVHIAGTGLSINRIFSLFSVDLGKSFTRVIQSIGRGLRMAHDKHEIVFYDICSDLKNGNKHLKDRVVYYNEAKYPYKIQKIKY